MNTASVDKVLALKSGESWNYDRGSGDAKKQHRHRNQNSFGITSEWAVGKPLLMGGPASARPPSGPSWGHSGSHGTLAARSLRATECGLADPRPGTLQGKPRPLPASPHLPFPALDLPSPRAPSPTVPPSVRVPSSSPLFIPQGQGVQAGEGRCGARSGISREARGQWECARRKHCPRGWAGPGTGGSGAPWGRCRGAAGPRAAGGRDLPAGAGPGAGAAPTCAGRPQARVAEAAQAAGLGLRGGFSITTSPARERAGRGAAPGAGARGGRARAGRGAILADAGACSSGRPWPRGPGGSHPAWTLRPRGAHGRAPTANPARGPRVPRRSPRLCGPCAAGATPSTPARSGSCAPAGPSPRPPGPGPTEQGSRTHRAGRAAAAEGGPPRPCGRHSPRAPVRSRARGGGGGGNNSSRLSTARAAPGSGCSPLRAFIPAPAL